MQKYVIWILTALLFRIKLKIFTKILQMKLKMVWHIKYEVDRSLPKGVNNEVIGLMKDDLGGKIMIEFVALRLIGWW